MEFSGFLEMVFPGLCPALQVFPDFLPHQLATLLRSAPSSSNPSHFLCIFSCPEKPSHLKSGWGPCPVFTGQPPLSESQEHWAGCQETGVVVLALPAASSWPQVSRSCP